MGLSSPLFLLVTVSHFVLSTVVLLPLLEAFQQPSLTSRQLQQQPACYSFHPHLSHCSTSLTKLFMQNVKRSSNKDNTAAAATNDEEGPNWIEKSFPDDTENDVQSMDNDEDEDSNNQKVDLYDVGVSGDTFQTGPLSQKIFEVMATQLETTNDDTSIRQAYMLYAMDMTAKEATKAALSHNGLDMTEAELENQWGKSVESIRLYDMDTNTPFTKRYPSLEDAVTQWSPGQPFDFVARQVPATLQEMSMEELMDTLDPDGTMREDAKQAATLQKKRQKRQRQQENSNNDDDEYDDEDEPMQFMEPDEETLLSIFEDEYIQSLSDMVKDNVDRAEGAPRGATLEGDAFVGDATKGYNVVHRSHLREAFRNGDGTEKNNVTMHVMDALVSHGVLLVDLTDGGTHFDHAESMHDMWKTAASFFDGAASETQQIPQGMNPATETGSEHAKVGYVEYDSGSMKFLETRIKHSTGELLPEFARRLLTEKGTEAMKAAFDIASEVGIDVTRVATAATNVEYGGFSDKKTKGSASQAATMMVTELLDNSKELDSSSTAESVSMSPHRLVRYSDQKDTDNEAREVFGAHTDSTFVTVIPVAAVSGLEVLDEAASKWYRPEQKARLHWEAELKKQGKDSSLDVDVLDNNQELPWHARYIAILAGELLQIMTRTDVPSTVHRVVAAKGSSPRLSAPVLLRSRPNMKLDVKRYLGGSLGNPLLQQCDGMTMREIHTANQPSANQ